MDICTPLGTNQHQYYFNMNKVIFDRIIANVCHDFNVTVEQLKEKNNAGVVVYPRQLIIYLYNKNNLGTNIEVAQFFRKNHATITHSIVTINDYIDTDPIKRKQIELYQSKIKIAIETQSVLDLYKNDVDELQKQLASVEFRYINVREKMERLIAEIKELNF